jgi:hypothetical protein
MIFLVQSKFATVLGRLEIPMPPYTGWPMIIRMAVDERRDLDEVQINEASPLRLDINQADQERSM